MTFSVPLRHARSACLSSVEAFRRAAGGLDDHALLAASGCHGWSRLDVVTHVLDGWQSMTAGLVTTTDAAPTVDAASYWAAFAEASGDADPVDAILAQRRRSDAYRRPVLALRHLADVADALVTGIEQLEDRPVRWQGHVFAAGDYLAQWSVENVVHLIDLRTDVEPPPGALQIARATVETLAGSPLPADWTDLAATLVGTGRAPAPEDTPERLQHLLPVLA